MWLQLAQHRWSVTPVYTTVHQEPTSYSQWVGLSEQQGVEAGRSLAGSCSRWQQDLGCRSDGARRR